MDASPITEWTPRPWFLVSAPRVNTVVLRRPRIEKLLDDLTSGHAVTLVAAPSGYAKSSVLASWVKHAARPKAWLTLTPAGGASDEQLLHGIISALHRIAPDTDVRDSLAIGALFPDPTGAEATLERIAETAMSLVEPLVLVIDDAHHAGPALAQGPVGILAENCGGMLRFVLAGSVGLATWFNRSLASGVAGHLGPAELALTATDIVAEIADGPKPSGAEREASEKIHADTGGWPIAVQMARMGTGQGILPHHLEAGEMMTEYVASSVLGRLRPELADFILAATTCQHLDSDLAAVLTGNQNSTLLLEECARQGIFVERYVDETETTVYRWQHLFAKQCRILLGRTNTARSRALNRAAATALAGRFPLEAIKHAMVCGDRELAMDILRSAWLRIVIDSGAGALHSLCLRLDTELGSCTEVLLVRACCLDALGDTKGSMLLLDRARAADRETGEGKRASAGTWAFAELFLSHDPQVLAASSDAAQLAMREENVDSVAHTYRQFYVGWTELRLRRNPAEAVRLLRSALRDAENAGLKTLASRIRANLIFALSFGGNLTAARALMDTTHEALPEALGTEWNHYDGGIEIFARGYTDYWQDRIPEAKHNFLEMTRRGGHQNSYTALARVYLALCAAATGDAREISDAETHLAGIGQSAVHGVPWNIYGTIAAASLRVASGNEAAGLALLAGVRETQNIPVVLTHSAEIYRIAGRHTEAMALLAGIEKAGMVSYVAVSALVTSAVISRERGDREEAHRQLEKALDVAAPQSIARPFAGKDTGLAALLTEHAVWGTAHEGFLASRITHADEGVSRHSILGSRLTSRELEVFGYLRTTMTAEEIAAALFVSVNTVRTHQRSIYRKLGVGTRREAIKYRP
ncbi:LuxR C-terminal-related transcriptional regulator [Paeniglutamicibacter sp. NPDC012692]|uniref:LuxR C-terminal-related transcriptional regulator n=1 Tax=Paeniglutamicibacter sp. NPDC012692 TaxID=3364388 RepID=UPI0036C07482